MGFKSDSDEITHSVWLIFSNWSSFSVSEAEPSQLFTSGPRTEPGRHIMIETDRDLSAMVQELWDNDVNRLKPGVDYKISLQVVRTQNRKHIHTEP